MDTAETSAKYILFTSVFVFKRVHYVYQYNGIVSK